MIRALIAGVIVGIIAPMIGNFLVVRRYSLMADTLGHVALAGVAIGLLFQTQPVIMAMVFTVLASIGIEQLRNTKKFYGESVLALFLSGSLAVAVVLISIANGFTVDLFGFLFGSITTVTVQDVYIIAIVGALVIALIAFFFRALFFVSFDDEVAQAQGVNVRGINLLLVILAAVTISLAMRIVGILLIGALMVIPVITAMQYGKSFRHSFGVSILISVFSIITGLFASYFLDLASGGTIVVITLIIFGLTLLVNRKQ